MNSLLPAARAERFALHSESDEARILDFLIRTSVGHENAKPWSAIAKWLNEPTFRMGKNGFQNGLLRRSRLSDFWIGSCRGGFFIIDEEEDALVAHSFNYGRIRSQIRNGQKLTSLTGVLPPEDDWDVTES